MTTMTVRALKESGFYLAKESVENSAELIEMLHYIDFLSQMNAKDAGALEVPIKDKLFSLTKSEVTKLFFDYIEEKKEVLQTAVKPIPQETMELIRFQLKATRDRMRKDALLEVVRVRNQAREYIRLANEKLAYAVIEKRKVDSVQQVDAALYIEEVAKGLPTTNWDFHFFDSYRKVLEFISRTDILLSYKLEDAGISYDLNCGRFKAEINLNNMRVAVRAWSGCVEQEDFEEPDNDDDNYQHYIHPNVDDGGGVCWGNASDTIEEAKLKGDILKVLQVLDALLPNYGQPAYISIEEFSESIARRDERLRSDREQENKEEEETEESIVEDGFTDIESLDHEDDDMEFPDITVSQGGESNE